MSDAWSLGPPPRTTSYSVPNPFAPPGGNVQNPGGNSTLAAATNGGGSAKTRHERVAGADVILNPDGSVTVANLKDRRGQPHTVYLPYQRQMVPGHNLRVFIDGLPLNPISHEHLWLAERARAIGCDTQLRLELKDLAWHELEALNMLAEAIIAGRQDDARNLYRRFRHGVHVSGNNFHKLARPLCTLLIIKMTPEGCLIDNAQTQIQLTYTVTSQGAALSVYFGKRGLHIWDR